MPNEVPSSNTVDDIEIPRQPEQDLCLSGALQGRSRDVGDVPGGQVEHP